MPDAPRANAVVGQSGGPTAVINESLVGVIEQAVQKTSTGPFTPLRVWRRTGLST